MSEMIVQVRNKMLRRIGGVNHFVSHNKDYTIQFQFDESWDNVRTKMAVFAYEDGEYGSEIFDGDTCNVPELPREGRILIGVKAGEDLSTELLCIPVCKSADDVITDEYDEPDPKIYEQILDIINNLWNGGTTVYPSPVKFLASPSAAKVGDLIRVKEVDENGDVTRTEGFDVGVELGKKIDAPQTAAVGEVLTVEEIGEDSKPKRWKTAPGVNITTELTHESTDTQVPSAKAVGDAIEKKIDKNQGTENAGKLLGTDEQGLVRATYAGVDYPIVITQNGETYTSDKTFGEILEAYAGGAKIYALMYSKYHIPLLQAENYCCLFVGIIGENGEYCVITIDEYTTITYKMKYQVPIVTINTIGDYMNYNNPPTVMNLNDDSAPDGGGILYYAEGMSDVHIRYRLITRDGGLYEVTYDRRYQGITFRKILLPLPSPTTAQVGQIVKVKCVDANGMITETEAIPHPVLYVTISKTGNTNTSDKTFAEIKSAYDSGCSVFAVVDSFVLPLLAVSDNAACFCATTPDGELHRVSVLITESSVSLAYGSFVEGNQGVENAGKILGIGASGIVTPVDKPVYTLPIATPTALGGVMPVAKTTAMTQGVGVSEDGKLYTAPSGGGTDKSLGITSATVGQIAKITAVDAQGKPTAWEPVDMPGGGGAYTLPIASPAVLGGVKPVAKTDAMTQGVGVDEAGALFTLPGGGSGEKSWRILRDIMITETVSEQSPNVTYFTNADGKIQAVEFSTDEDGAAFSVSEIVLLMMLESDTNSNISIFKGGYTRNIDIASFRNLIAANAKRTIYIHLYNLFDQYTMAEFYNYKQWQNSGLDGSWGQISNSPAFADTTKMLDSWKPGSAVPWTGFALGTGGNGISGRVVFFAR